MKITVTISRKVWKPTKL